MDWTLEVVVVPVTDVDVAKRFYSDQLGFHVDHDVDMGLGRILQLTPPGSGCSIVLRDGGTRMTPGSLSGVQLVVPDILRAHRELTERGVAVSEVQVVTGDLSALERGGAALDNIGFLFFEDPDGNEWAVQQISRAR